MLVKEPSKAASPLLFGQKKKTFQIKNEVLPQFLFPFHALCNLGDFEKALHSAIKEKQQKPHQHELSSVSIDLKEDRVYSSSNN